jgi:hypothetical protein
MAKDQNPSATNSTPNMPENSTKPTLKKMNLTSQRPLKHSKQAFTSQRPLKHSKQASLQTGSQRPSKRLKQAFTRQRPSKHSKKASLQTGALKLPSQIVYIQHQYGGYRDNLSLCSRHPRQWLLGKQRRPDRKWRQTQRWHQGSNQKTTPHLKSIEPMGQNAPTESNGPHLIKTIQQFEDGLPQNDSQQEESKTFKQVADGCSKNDSQQEESQLENLTHEFVHWHYKCQHPQWVAKSGILPPCQTTCRVPQASRWPWKEKGSANKIATATSPGQIVSMDQIQSMVPGQFRAYEGFACSLNVRVPHNHNHKNQIKWEQHAQPVSYLASLSKHASSVPLVFDPHHHKFDDLFKTVSLSWLNFQADQSLWQYLCHFGKGKTDTSKKAVQPPRDTNMSIIPIPLLPGGTSYINGDEAIASEGVNQGSEHVYTTPMASEIVVGRRSWCTRRLTQRFTKSQQQLTEGVTPISPHTKQ